MSATTSSTAGLDVGFAIRPQRFATGGAARMAAWDPTSVLVQLSPRQDSPKQGYTAAVASTEDTTQSVYILREVAGSAAASEAAATLCAFRGNDGDVVTCLHWIELRASAPVLAVGFSSGILRLFDTSGRVLLCQVLHKDRVVRMLSDRMNGLLVAHPDVVCHVTGRTVLGSLHAVAMRESSSSSGDAGPEQARTWSFEKWSLPPHERLTDVVVCGDLEPPSLAVELAGAPLPTKPRLLVVGSNPAVAFYAPDESAAGGLTAVAQAGSWIASRVASTVFSLARSWIGGGGSRGSSSSGDGAETESAGSGVVNMAAVKSGPATPVSPDRFLEDAPRTVTSVVLDRSGRYALTCDELGRVLLLDARHFVALRMWKGYRDAQCAFVRVREMPGAPRCALLYAPRRGQLELWILLGPRLGVKAVAPGWRLCADPARDGQDEGALFISPRLEVSAVSFRRPARPAARSTAAAQPRPGRAGSAGGPAGAVAATPGDGGGAGPGATADVAPAAASPVTTDVPALLAQFRRSLRLWGRNHPTGSAGCSSEPEASEYAEITAVADAYLHAALEARNSAPGGAASPARLDVAAGDSPADTLGGLEEALIGPGALVGVHVAGSAAGERGRASQLVLPATIRMDIAQRTCVALERRARFLERLERTGRRDQATALEVAAARTLLGRLSVCLAALQCYASAARCAHFSRPGNVMQDSPPQQQQLLLLQETSSPSVSVGGGATVWLELPDFLAAFSISRSPPPLALARDGPSPAASARLSLRPGMSLAEQSALGSFLFGQPYTHHTATSVLTHLKCTGLDPRRVMALFSGWYASTASPGSAPGRALRRPGGVLSAPPPTGGRVAGGSSNDDDGSDEAEFLAAVVRAMATVFNRERDEADGGFGEGAAEAEAGAAAVEQSGSSASPSGEFFEAVVRFCRTTTLFDHGIRLARMCALVENDESGLDSATPVQWVVQLENCLTTAKVLRSFLPDVDRLLVTVARVATDWPVGRLLAAQLHGLGPPRAVAPATGGGAVAQWPAGGDATAAALQLGLSQVEVDVETAKRKGRLPAAVTVAGVQACRHLLSPEFGFSGIPASDADIVMFYCAQHLLALYLDGSPSPRVLAACVEHTEQLEPGAVAGGLALHAWSSALSPHVTAILSASEGLAATPFGVAAVSVAAAAPRIFDTHVPQLLPLVQQQWGLEPERSFGVLVAANRILAFLDRCLAAEDAKPTIRTDSWAASSLSAVAIGGPSSVSGSGFTSAASVGSSSTAAATPAAAAAALASAGPDLVRAESGGVSGSLPPAARGPMRMAAFDIFREVVLRAGGTQATRQAVALYRRVVATLGEYAETELRLGLAPPVPRVSAMFADLATSDPLTSAPRAALAASPSAATQSHHPHRGTAGAAAEAADQGARPRDAAGEPERPQASRGVIAPAASVSADVRARERRARADFVLGLFFLLPDKPVQHHLGLAGFLGLDAEEMRQQFIVLMYQQGRDVPADEMLLQVEHREALALPALRVALDRLARVLLQMRSNKALSEHALARIPPAYWEFLEADSRPWSPPALERPVPSRFLGPADIRSAVHMARLAKSLVGDGNSPREVKAFAAQLLDLANRTSDVMAAFSQQ